MIVMFCCEGAVEAQHAGPRAAANKTKQEDRFQARDVRRLMRGGAGAHTRRVWDDLMEAWGGKGGGSSNREGAGGGGGGSECGQGHQDSKKQQRIVALLRSFQWLQCGRGGVVAAFSGH